MLKYILQKVGQAVLVLLIVTFLAFLLLTYMPGDMAYALVGPDASPEQVAALRTELGLDQPFLVRFFTWLTNTLKGDLGYSEFYKDTVANILVKRIPVTFIIGLISLLVSLVFGVVLGIVAAVYRGKAGDYIVSLIANFGIAAPQFWIAVILMYTFSFWLGWLPIEGYTPPSVDFGMFLKQIILPVTTLSITSVAAIARQTRSAVLETINQDYVRTARSKGLKQNTILAKHVLKNALIPVLTLLGLRVRVLFGGAVLIEKIYNIPGMGRMMVDAITMQDTNMAQGGLLVIGIVVIFSTLLVDIAYGIVDPRIRDAREG